ncbi:hypothetical protein DFJ73DRAFT_212280 [Zopfochytrium polystomum]|nr:hypothetical protein DFJ73DRAFT_212280 [Zopfochytrium polystomum]
MADSLNAATTIAPVVVDHSNTTATTATTTTTTADPAPAAAAAAADPTTTTTTTTAALLALLHADRGFPVVAESLLFKRYIAISNRTVRMPRELLPPEQQLQQQDEETDAAAAAPAARVVDWDVVGPPPAVTTAFPNFCVVFVYHTATRTTTLLLEYMQGINSVRYGMISGGYEPKKHASMLECAQMELSEEGRLTGGRWVPLLPHDAHRGIMEVKWCANRFAPFLVVDPVPDGKPGKRDVEECMEVVPGVTMAALDAIILEGNLALTAVQTSIMARAWLAREGLL